MTPKMTPKPTPEQKKTGPRQTKPKTKKKNIKATSGKITEVGTSLKTDIHFFQRSPMDVQDRGFKSLFSKAVKLETIVNEIRRDETTSRALAKVSGDVFDKWFEVITTFDSKDKPNLKLKREIENINQRLSVKETFKHAWELKKILGFSLITLGWIDDATLEQAPKNLKGIDYIHPLSKFQVASNGLKIDYKRNSDTYGQMVGAVIKFNYESSKDSRGITLTTITEERFIPSSRFLHWVNFAPGSLDPYGMSAFEPIYDVLEVKKNLDWAFAEAAFQFAARKYVLITPANVEPEYWEYVKNNWKDFDSLTTFVAKGEGHQVISFGGEGQLNPDPYFSYYVTLLTTGLGVPRSILFHESITGAEWVLKDYYQDIVAIQKTEVEPILLEFYKRLQEEGVLSKGRIEFDWINLLELDEREKSFVQSRFALGHRMQSEAVSLYNDIGLAVKLNADGWIERVFVPVGDKPEGDNEFILYPSVGEPSATPPDAKKVDIKAFKESLRSFKETIEELKDDKNNE